MPGRVRERTITPEEIVTAIRQIFAEASENQRNHQKNVIALHKLHEKAAALTETREDGDTILVGETRFKNGVIDVILRVLPEKKGVSPADKAIKFLGEYVKHMNSRAAQDNKGKEELSIEKDIDTPASRFTENLFKYLLKKGFTVKDKNVRYRMTQICAETLSHLGEVDSDLCDELRETLLERLNDKEPIVRTQAAIALCRFAWKQKGKDEEEDEEEEEEEEEDRELQDVLLESLATDDSPEVRRAILANLPIAESTIDHILERSRDVDTQTRRLVYAVLAKDLSDKSPSHPNEVTDVRRELLCRNGLTDREGPVCVAAAGFLLKWIELLKGHKKEQVDVKIEEEEQQDDELGGIISLVEKFELDDGTMANKTLHGIFDYKPETFKTLRINGEGFWKSLTPAKTLVGRTFVEQCDTVNEIRKDPKKYPPKDYPPQNYPDMTEHREAALPTATTMAFGIEGVANKLFEIIRDIEVGDLDDEDQEKAQEERKQYEFMLDEMLKISVKLDYQDEMGRRKMPDTIRDLLKREGLPDRHASRGLDVLRILSPSEGDLIRQVVEIIEEIQDLQEEEEEMQEDQEGSDDQPPKSRYVKLRMREDMTPAEQERYDKTTLTSLTLLEGCLERCHGTLDRNAMLDGLIENLVKPSILRKDAVFQERGLVCLALVSYISKPHALQVNHLFLDGSQKENISEEMRIIALKAVLDLLMMHPQDLFRMPGRSHGEYVEYFLRLLNSLALHNPSSEMLAVLSQGLMKLALIHVLEDSRIIAELIILSIHPNTSKNLALRQCLAFSIPVFCHALPENQEQVASVFMKVFSDLCNVDSEENDVTMPQVGSMLVEWTDPLRVMDDKGNLHVQLELLKSIVKDLLADNCPVDRPSHRKVLFQLFSKLYLPDEADQLEVCDLKYQIDTLRSKRPPRETVAKAAFNKFVLSFEKKYEEHLKDYSMEDIRKDERFKDTVQRCDDVTLLDDDDEDRREKKSRKRSTSVLSTTTEEGGSTRVTKGKSKAKKRRISASDDEDSYETGTERGVSTPPQSSAPTRTMPKRAATKKPARDYTRSHLNLDEGEDGDTDDDDVETTPRVSNRTRTNQASTSTSRSSAGGSVRPSISSAATIAQFDDEDEDDENEVSFLLAGDEDD